MKKTILILIATIAMVQIHAQHRCGYDIPLDSTYHRINYDCVLEYITNYITHPDLQSISAKTPISGFISLYEIEQAVSSDTAYKAETSKSKLRSNLLSYFQNNKDSHNALRFYLSYNIRFPRSDDFFLSIKYISDYDPYVVCCHCPLGNKETLYRSDNEYFYNEERSEAGVDTFLNRMRGENSLLYATEQGEDIRFYAYAFLRNFIVDDAATNQEICGVFRYEEMRQLLEQERLTGIRFFLGYDAMDHPRNKIRLILIGVKEDGRNILLDPSNTAREGVFLEKSWPPF